MSLISQDETESVDDFNKLQNININLNTNTNTNSSIMLLQKGPPSFG